MKLHESKKPKSAFLYINSFFLNLFQNFISPNACLNPSNAKRVSSLKMILRQTAFSNNQLTKVIPDNLKIFPVDT